MSPEGESLFRLKGLRFRFGDRPVLEIPELSVEEEAVTVLAGANGAGKTTLLRLLAGLIRPASGQLLYRGRPLAGRPGAAGRVVLVHQDPYLFGGTVSWNVAYGLRVRGERGEALRRRVEEALDLTGLPGFDGRRADQLSGGERKRVAIARALALQPEVLLLDEPTASVDAASVGLIEELVRRLPGRGTSVVLATHHLPFAFRLCDRLVSLQEGRLVPSRENIYRGRVEGRDDRFTYFRPKGPRVLRCPSREGEFTTAVVASADVILSQAPLSSSAQNQWEGTVTAVQPVDHMFLVTVDCGVAVQATVTPASVEELAVRAGRRLCVSFKTSAVRLY